MAIHMKIRIPVYKKNKWESFLKHGKITVSSDIDTISEGYKALKEEIDQLLTEMEASSQLAGSLNEMEDEIRKKTYTLQSLTDKINKATEHYESLALFLKQFGVDPEAKRLTFDKKFILESAAATAIEVPIEVPKDSGVF